MSFPADTFSAAVGKESSTGQQKLAALGETTLDGITQGSSAAANALRSIEGFSLPGTQTSGRSLSEFDRAIARPDPLLSNSWDVLIVYKGITINISDYVEEVTLPSVKVDSKQVFRQGIFVNYAKTESTGSLTLKLYETADLIAYRFFRLWKNQVRDPQGNYGLASDYKGKIQLTPIDADRSSTRMFEARGVFPTSLSGYHFSGGQTERVAAEIEMSCDEIVPMSLI